MKKVLIAIPAYSEEQNIIPLYESIHNTLDSLATRYDF